MKTLRGVVVFAGVLGAMVVAGCSASMDRSSDGEPSSTTSEAVQNCTPGVDCQENICSNFGTRSLGRSCGDTNGPQCRFERALAAIGCRSRATNSSMVT